jgi:CBS domain-containing protein
LSPVPEYPCNVLDCLSSKRYATLIVIDSNATVQTAVLLLSRPGIGLIVVCNASGGAEGVLSKSDLVRHLTGPMSSTPPVVSGLMSEPIVSCGPQDDVHDVWENMAARNLQNIPVVDGSSRPLGILDIPDAMKALLEEEIQAQMLFNYVTGVGYR